jgi:hypothetical protein
MGGGGAAARMRAAGAGAGDAWGGAGPSGGLDAAGDELFEVPDLRVGVLGVDRVRGMLEGERMLGRG